MKPNKKAQGKAIAVIVLVIVIFVAYWIYKEESKPITVIVEEESSPFTTNRVWHDVETWYGTITYPWWLELLFILHKIFDSLDKVIEVRDLSFLFISTVLYFLVFNVINRRDKRRLGYVG